MKNRTRILRCFGVCCICRGYARIVRFAGTRLEISPSVLGAVLVGRLVFTSPLWTLVHGNITQLSTKLVCKKGLQVQESEK